MEPRRGLVGYGSDDDSDSEQPSTMVSGSSQRRRRDSETNYDDVNMDMSEESQPESEPELPPAEAPPPKHGSRPERPRCDLADNRRDSRDRDSRDRDSARRRDDRDRRRDKHDDKHARSEKGRERRGHDSKRGLLGDRPADRPDDNTSDKIPSLMDARPYGEPSSHSSSSNSSRSQDARDAVSPRFVERDRRDKDRVRGDRERERDRHGRRSEERRSNRSRGGESHPRSRSRSRDHARRPGASHLPLAADVHTASSSERLQSQSSGEYRPTSYKVNKKLEVMEKMGLQIKTPDGSMATAQQLRQAASEPAAPQSGPMPSYYNATGINTNKIMDQVQKRKLLWSGKNRSEAAEAAKWTGTRFAQDNDGRQANKFMRLMGIKEPAAVVPVPDTVDPVKKQEELFQAMQAQYEVARATTHTMRGVGLGFQRQF